MIDMRCASMGERRFVAVNMRLFADLERDEIWKNRGIPESAGI
jgi:hypothetical protein